MRNHFLAGILLTLTAMAVALASNSSSNQKTPSPASSLIEAPLPASPYVQTFQIQNRLSDPSPWMLYPTGKTVWLVTIKLGIPVIAQLVNFTLGVSTAVANISNAIPSDIVYDRFTSSVWILENQSLAFYDPAAKGITPAVTFENQIPQYLAIDPQDRYWLTLDNTTLASTNQIVEYNATGRSYLEYATPTLNAGLQGIAVSPVDDSIWFAEAYVGRIGHLIPCGTSSCLIEEYSPPPGLNIQGVIQVAIDKAGTVWFTVHDGNEFGSFNPNTGQWHLYPIGYCPDNYVQACSIGLPNAISLDSNGQIWFSEHYAGRIGRYDPNSSTLVEYDIPTTSAICNKSCEPYSWWMWPGPNNLVWFTSYGLGEIGYVNSSVPVPLRVTSPSTASLAQGTSIHVPITATYGGQIPYFGASITSLDAASKPSMLSWSVNYGQTALGTLEETASISISASWSSTLGSRYIALTAYNGNFTVNAFINVNVLPSVTAYTTIGFVSGISALTVASICLRQFSKGRRASADPSLE